MDRVFATLPWPHGRQRWCNFCASPKMQIGTLGGSVCCTACNAPLAVHDQTKYMNKIEGARENKREGAKERAGKRDQKMIIEAPRPSFFLLSLLSLVWFSSRNIAKELDFNLQSETSFLSARFGFEALWPIDELSKDENKLNSLRFFLRYRLPIKNYFQMTRYFVNYEKSKDQISPKIVRTRIRLKIPWNQNYNLLIKYINQF